jgi:hypothetical protein
MMNRLSQLAKWRNANRKIERRERLMSQRPSGLPPKQYKPATNDIKLIDDDYFSDSKASRTPPKRPHTHNTTPQLGTSTKARRRRETRVASANVSSSEATTIYANADPQSLAWKPSAHNANELRWFARQTQVLGRPYEDSMYQWMPAEFTVSPPEDGPRQVAITSRLVHHRSTLCKTFFVWLSIHTHYLKID